MKKIFLSLLAIAMVVSFSNKVVAQVSVTPIATAGAVLVKTLTIVETTKLHFGTIGIKSGTPGSVVMGTDGVRTPQETTTTVLGKLPARAVALFTLTGTASVNYKIVLPSAITLTVASVLGGTPTITVGTLRVKEGSQIEEAWAASIQGTFDPSGDASFLLAGTLPFASDQDIGIYSGTYNVTVDYE